MAAKVNSAGGVVWCGVVLLCVECIEGAIEFAVPWLPYSFQIPRANQRLSTLPLTSTCGATLNPIVRLLSSLMLA
eukprot:SAG31_NODE_4633_length_3083_cov_5.088807_6_plen_75_part_00